MRCERFLQAIAYFIPLRYYLVIIRSLLLKGVRAVRSSRIWRAVFGVVIMGAAAALPEKGWIKTRLNQFPGTKRKRSDQTIPGKQEDYHGT
jgi:hypothetical protein